MSSWLSVLIHRTWKPNQNNANNEDKLIWNTYLRGDDKMSETNIKGHQYCVQRYSYMLDTPYRTMNRWTEENKREQ